MEYTDRVKCWAVQQKDGLWTVELESINTGRTGRAQYGQAKYGQHGPIIRIETDRDLGFEKGKEYEITIVSVG
jgi:hypothetical protein